MRDHLYRIQNVLKLRQKKNPMGMWRIELSCSFGKNVNSINKSVIDYYFLGLFHIKISEKN